MAGNRLPVYAWDKGGTLAHEIDWAGHRSLAVTRDWGQHWACGFCFQPWATGHACAQTLNWRRAFAAYVQG